MDELLYLYIVNKEPDKKKTKRVLDKSFDVFIEKYKEWFMKTNFLLKEESDFEKTWQSFRNDLIRSEERCDFDKKVSLFDRLDIIEATESLDNIYKSMLKVLNTKCCTFSDALQSFDFKKRHEFYFCDHALEDRLKFLKIQRKNIVLFFDVYKLCIDGKISFDFNCYYKLMWRDKKTYCSTGMFKQKNHYYKEFKELEELVEKYK